MAQIDPINWQLALLTQNPFPKVPPSHPEEAIWVGFPDLKKQFDTVFTEVFSSARTQVILNRGAYGSGKTHVATFCRRKDYLAQFQSKELAQPFEVISTRTPMEHDKADIQLFQTIVEALGFKYLRSLMKDIINELGSEAALTKLQELAGSEALGKALWLLGYKKTRSGRLTPFQDEDMIDNHHRLLERYLSSQNTKGDLKRLDLSRSIIGMRERFQVLSAILQCVIGLDNGDNNMRHKRIILWIDQTEGLIQYHPQYFHPFTQGLRDLVYRLPCYFTLFLNFTAAEHRLNDYIGCVLGRELTNCITKQIYFREPTEDESFEYVKDLMHRYRTDDFEQSGLPAIYPFDEDALCLLIENLFFRTPLAINKCCAYAIEEAIKQGIIHHPGEGRIDAQFVQSIAEQCESLEA